jgi:hypothetical protein
MRSESVLFAGVDGGVLVDKFGSVVFGGVVTFADPGFVVAGPMVMLILLGSIPNFCKVAVTAAVSSL